MKNTVLTVSVFLLVMKQTVKAVKTYQWHAKRLRYYKKLFLGGALFQGTDDSQLRLPRIKIILGGQVSWS